jgi:HAD superfamily hydrolase (TIGR01509 family)
MTASSASRASTPGAVLFDLDGVLAHSEEAWFRTLEAAGQHFRGRPVTRAEFAPTFGQSSAENVRVFGFGCSAEALDAYFIETFPRFAAEARTEPAAAGVLDALGARGLLRAVVTNAMRPIAEAALAAGGLTGRLEHVACAGGPLRPKPAPDLLVHALAALGVPASAAWMVGDSRFDREAAAAAGVHFVGLRMQGDVRLERLEDLPALLPPPRR